MAAWQRLFPEVLPINHQFKSKLSARWVRIHSLPDAQRYPKSPADWDMLLTRQNAVINHLVLKDAPITWVWNRLAPDSPLFSQVALVRIGLVRAAEDEVACDCWLLNGVWQRGACDAFLTMIADEQMRAFIIAPDCLISPYDGGMDIILKDSFAVESFKRHFADWMSRREDGL